MEEPKEFGLLDDDDDITSSPLFDINFNIGGATNNSSPNPAATFSNNKIPIGAMNHHSVDSTFQGSDHQVLNTIRVQNKTNNSITVNNQSTLKTGQKRQTSTKFNISPNKPNSGKLELKAIERPRSHSPLKMSGIEEYVQLYGKRNSIEQLNQTNKITMNLKMDDLLATKTESSAYQMLSDFSVLTGDIDNFNDLSSRVKTGRKRVWIFQT